MSADWEVELSFQIGGPQTLGGDGLAFWYAKDAGQEGPVFGSRDRWLGLGVFVDTYDNDGARDNPRVSVVVNDGNRGYNAATDGRDIELGGCTAPLRRTAGAAGLLVRYDGAAQRLRVEYSTAPGRWTECVAAHVALPAGYRFGVSAATGALSDTHDVYRLVTRRLRSDDDDGAPAAAAAPASAATASTASTASTATTANTKAPATPERTAQEAAENKNAEVEELRRQIAELRRAAEQKQAPAEKKEEEKKEKIVEAGADEVNSKEDEKKVKEDAAPAVPEKVVAATATATTEKKEEEEEDPAVLEKLAGLEAAVRATAARAGALEKAAAALAAAERAAAGLRVPARAEGGAAAVDDAALRAELARQLLQLRRSVEQAQDAVRAAVATHTDALRTRLAALGTALGTAPAPASSRGGVGGALVLVFVLVQAAFAGAMLQLFRQQNRQKKFL